MSKSTVSGPLRAGYPQDQGTASPQIGPVLLAKTFNNYPGWPNIPAGTNPNGSAYILTADGTTAKTITISIPANAQIIDFTIDVLNAYTATTAALTIGTAPAGTQYVSGIDVKTAGRAAITFTAAQLTAMANVGANTSLSATVTSTGPTTTGSVLVTVRYIQW